jgi:hypothetical protein
MNGRKGSSEPPRYRQPWWGGPHSVSSPPSAPNPRPPAGEGSKRSRGRLIGLLGSLLLALQSGAGLAQDAVYTWKDAAGRVHYGNRPPEGQPAQPVDLNPKPVSVQATEHIYTWTDTEGKIHYGPQPPPDIPAKELKEDDTSLSTIRSGQLRSGEQQLLRDLRRRQ